MRHIYSLFIYALKYFPSIIKPQSDQESISVGFPTETPQSPRHGPPLEGTWDQGQRPLTPSFAAGKYVKPLQMSEKSNVPSG